MTLNQTPFLNWEHPGKALITGASAGIGASFAKAFARKGFDLILLARRKDRLRKLADELESEYAIHCDIISADLSDSSDVEKVVNDIQKTENLDVLINNAGFATIGYFADIPIEKSMRMFHTHMAASVQLTHAALQGMLSRGRGAIINVSSVGAFLLTPGNVMYDATKSFLATFSENLSLEVNDRSIRIQALCPGFTRTEFHDVGDFKNFDKSEIPESMWMMPDDVVSLSLQALEKNKKVVFIAGKKYRVYTWLMLHVPLLHKMVQRKVKERDLTK